MFKWNYSENVTTKATAEQIWAMWQDVSSWPCWDSELKSVKLNGNFIEGTTGIIKPVNGPKVIFTLKRVEPFQAFSNVARLPFTNLIFNHEYFGSPEKGGSAQICHSVIMTGWLAPVFGFLIGNKIKNHLRDAMLELTRRAITEDKTLH